MTPIRKCLMHVVIARQASFAGCLGTNLAPARPGWTHNLFYPKAIESVLTDGYFRT